MTAHDPSRRGRPPGSADSRPRRMALLGAIRAARNAGLRNFRVDIDREGTISVFSLADGDMSAKPGGANEWDEVLKE